MLNRLLLRDVKEQLERHRTIEEIAHLLCRPLDEVRAAVVLLSGCSAASA
jgi:hypothetical protein